MQYDAIVVGSGPNGLTAAVTLARAGCHVKVFESGETIGGGTRTTELTMPGYRHDVCSAIHPLGIASPCFGELPLEEHGLRWIHPSIPVAHPMPDGSVATLQQSLDATVEHLAEDGEAYRRLLKPFVDGSDQLLRQVLSPLSIPRQPIRMARFGWKGLRSAEHLAKRWFQQDRVQGMFAGMAAHAILPLDRYATAAVGLMFCITAHSRGWPLPHGGSQSIADALASLLRAHGGSIQTGERITSLAELPDSKAILLDVSPHSLAAIAKDHLPPSYLKRLKKFRHGPGVFKLDWALNGPIPWTAEDCRKAGTVHVGGAFDDIAASEAAAWNGETIDRPFVLVGQQSLFDPSRAPSGKHTGWAYCHVPCGSTHDMTDSIERQIERFAPGFRGLILKRHVMRPLDLQNYNDNYVGGDISGGVMDLRQLVTRPVARLDPYRTPNNRIYLCSASTPPGPGVHGMCGYHAARSALRHVLK